MPAERYLIINADDFGLTHGISQGIIDGFNRGIVTSTSLMATMPAFDHAVSLARKNKGLDVGIHISLTAGRPCSPNTGLWPILEKGEFVKSYMHLFKRLYAGRITLDDLRMEMTAQVEKVLGNGLEISHLNSHQHVLMLPCLAKAAAEVAAEYGIPFVRFPNERIPLRKLGSAKGWGFFILWVLGSVWRRTLAQSHSRIQFADHFRGLSFSENMTLNDLMSVLSSLQPGLTELACHPGYKDETFHRIYREPFRREMELHALMSSEVKQYVAHYPLRLTSYRNMVGVSRIERFPLKKRAFS